MGRRVPPSRTIPIARLEGGEVHSLIGSSIQPRYEARQELLALWDSLSSQGRKAVLTAARLTAKEEDILPESRCVIAREDEVS